jgi:hypothetical protein
LSAALEKAVKPLDQFLLDGEADSFDVGHSSVPSPELLRIDMLLLRDVRVLQRLLSKPPGVPMAVCSGP